MGRDYSGEHVTVHWDATRCIHAGWCTAGLPTVFDARRRPRVDPTGADAAQIAEVVERCPTGALRYTRHDGGPAEAGPDVTSVTPAPGGPLLVRGRLQVTGPDGTVAAEETRVALCRCGGTQNPPFCDNSHRRTGFRAAEGRPAPARAEAPDEICERQDFGPLR